MMATKMTADEKKWRGREAANTLAEAERIKKDPTLSRLAAKEAQNMAREAQAQAAAMAKVAKVKPNGKSANKK
jgi:hypothetical protein